MSTVILAGNIGLDESWTGGLPRSLLPLPQSTLISDLLGKISAALAGRCTLCVNGDHRLLRRRLREAHHTHSEIFYQEDSLPQGTAGCIKACESSFEGGEVFVAGASTWLEDDPLWMLEQHRAQGNALTIFCIRHQVGVGRSEETRLRPAGLYICNPEVLDFIPTAGYQDLKEQLVPLLHRAGLRVGAVQLRHQTHQVADWPTYLHAVTRSLSSDAFHTEGYQELAPAIWVGKDVRIAPDARVVGPALLGHGCVLGKGSVVVGPAMLGDGCRVGADAWVVRTVSPAGMSFASGSSTSDRLVTSTGLSMPRSARVIRRPFSDGFSAPDQAGRASSDTTDGSHPRNERVSPRGLLGVVPSIAALLGVFVWAFWSNLTGLWSVWQTNEDYSVGQLVPLASFYMLLSRRAEFAGLKLSLAPAGLILFALGLLMNLFGYHYLFASFSNFGMVICVLGLAMSLLGWSGFRRVWYPFAFLLFMIPLPGRVHDAIMLPLQNFGAQISASVLEIIGVPVERFGHVLEVAGQHLAVAEACNGLRMAMAFLIVAGLVAYFIRRPVWQRVAIVVSSVPIAIACNVVRLVATALLYSAGHAWLAQGMFHDGVGFLMMPLALSMIFLEMWLFSNLVMPPSADAVYLDGVDRTAVLSAR